jgi:predicted short-subunit dehydrogenase-like oxidoreductase (DUF2520 family)
MKIALIGAGRVARFLGHRLQAQGHEITGVYSRTQAHAVKLASELQCEHTASLHALKLTCDVVLISVSDDAIAPIASQLKLKEQLVLHTAGSLSIDLLSQTESPRYGTLYPLFSFTGEPIPANIQIPFLIESNNTNSHTILRNLAEQISDRVQDSTHNQRLLFHLAAVFANNFSNQLFALSDELLAANGLTLDLLLPMLSHQVEQLKKELPKNMQTGPALRGDTGTIERHLAMLNDRPDLQEIYTILTASIQRTAKS